MAAPTSASVADISGVWRMDSTKSDSLDPMLKIQGVPWLLRKSIAYITIELTLRHTPPEGDTPGAIKAKTVVKPGSIGDIEETHVLDNQAQEKTGKQGRVTSRNRVIAVDEIEEADVKERIKTAHEGNEVLVEYLTALDKNWQTQGYWIFEVIDGARYLVRLTLVLGAAKERVLLRTVYGYVGETP